MTAAILEIASGYPTEQFKGSLDDLFEQVDDYVGLGRYRRSFDNAIEFLAATRIAKLHRHSGVRDYVVVNMNRRVDDIFQEPPEDGNVASALFSDLPWKYHIVGSYLELGSGWLEDYIASKLNTNEFDALDSSNDAAPAAGRIVTLKHNQIARIEDETEVFLSIVAEEEPKANKPNLLEQLIGQVKAGRELIRSAILDLELLKMSMVAGLQMLVEQYKDHAIGAAASNLLALLLKQIPGLNS